MRTWPSDAARGGDEASQVPYEERLPVLGVFDCARWSTHSPVPHLLLLSSASMNCIDTSKLCLCSSIPCPRSPLSTLHVTPRGVTRMTRGRGGWLGLTPCGTFTRYSSPALPGALMDQFTRRLIGFGIYAGDVDGVALCCMFNRVISGHKPPSYLSSDHDPLFEYPCSIMRPLRCLQKPVAFAKASR